MDDGGFEELVAALEAGGASVRDIARLVVTHPHIDHYGMAGRVLEEAGDERLWMHAHTKLDLDVYRDPGAAGASVRQMLSDHGVARQDLDELAAFEDWRPFVARVVEPGRSLEGGEHFEVGGRTWEIVHTPGHARSHICLWSPRDRIFISGDHLLPSITPHIDFRRGADTDPLGEYLGSLEKTVDLDPALVLPGHGHPLEAGAERARAIIRHHDRRLGSILQVIRKEPHTAMEITEAIFGEALLNFERRLALGEALAHLAHLRNAGDIERIELQDGTLAYVKAAGRRAVEDED